MNISVFRSKRALFFGIATSSILLISWSPTAPDVVVQIGSGNDTNGFTDSEFNITSYRGFISGSNNVAGSLPGSAAIIGETNSGNAYASIIVGSANKYAKTGTTSVTSARYMGLFGSQNEIANSNTHLLVSGYGNAVNATGALVSGTVNSVEGVSGSASLHSMAVGCFNSIVAAKGWAIGDGNTVSATHGVAIGTDTLANQPNGTALGKFNSAMNTNDVLVVGTGADDVNRATAFTVTSDGGVILGRAQGDISMGDYAN